MNGIAHEAGTCKTVSPQKQNLAPLFYQKCEYHAAKMLFLRIQIPVITNTISFALSNCKAVAKLFTHMLTWN